MNAYEYGLIKFNSEPSELEQLSRKQDGMAPYEPSASLNKSHVTQILVDHPHYSTLMRGCRRGDPYGGLRGNDCDRSTEPAIQLNQFLVSPAGAPLPQNSLPDLSCVAWHASAGTDLRPLVIYSDGYLSNLAEEVGITRPKAHVFTCMGGGAEEKWLRLLKSDGGVIYDDGRTRIRVKNYQFLRMLEPYRRLLVKGRPFCDMDREDHFAAMNADGFTAEIEILDPRSGYKENTSLLYLFSENIKTYVFMVSRSLVRTSHLYIPCEGLAMGGCRKSISDVVFAQNPELYGLSGSHYPETVTLSESSSAAFPIKELIRTGKVKAERLCRAPAGCHSDLFKITAQYE